VTGHIADGFARLVGRQATGPELQRLYEVRDSLGLADNDALWVVLIALEHYDSLFRGYPAQLATETRRSLDAVQQAFSRAAALEAKRAHRKLADMVADTSFKLASKRIDAALVHGFAAAAAILLAFGGLCLSMGYAIGSGRVPPWTHGTGVRRLVSAALGAPVGWLLLVLVVPLSGLWVVAGLRVARAPHASRVEMVMGSAIVVVAVATVVAAALVLLQSLL
jgi:hypothetical protein